MKLLYWLQGELSMETNAKTVTGALGVLSQRMDLLTPGHLDAVEGRLAALTQKMNNIAEAKTKVYQAIFLSFHHFMIFALFPPLTQNSSGRGLLLHIYYMEWSY